MDAQIILLAAAVIFLFRIGQSIAKIEHHARDIDWRLLEVEKHLSTFRSSVDDSNVDIANMLNSIERATGEIKDVVNGYDRQRHSSIEDEF